MFSTYAELRPDGPELNELASIIRQELRVETDLQGTFQALDDLLDQICLGNGFGSMVSERRTCPAM